jgi:hypothetical protein
MSDNIDKDFLRGAKQIAVFLFGDPKYARRVFHLASCRRLPVFRMGSAGLWARKSTLLDYIRDQERGAGDPDQPSN